MTSIFCGVSSSGVLPRVVEVTINGEVELLAGDGLEIDDRDPLVPCCRLDRGITTARHRLTQRAAAEFQINEKIEQHGPVQHRSPGEFFHSAGAG